jgi:predicted NUDIX family NTP pyrophosphohydrolase
VIAWAMEGDLDPAAVTPGTFRMQWPPRSGRTAEFPELDRVQWLGLDRAREVIVTAQAAFLDRLAEHSR